MARPHSSRTRGSKLAATTSAEEREGDGDTGEDEPGTTKRYPTRRSSGVASKTNTTTKKPSIATAKKPTFGSLTASKSANTSKATTSTKATTRSQKAVVDAELEPQAQANGKRGRERPAKVTGTAGKMEAKIKAPRKTRKSTAAGGKGEKQVKISDENWQSMRGFGSFIVNHPKDKEEEYKFTTGDTICILPHGRSPDESLEPWEYWIGKIRDIRAEIHVVGGEEHNTVYVRVQWLYSGKDVGDVVKSFDAGAISPYERIFSDHYDIIEPQSVDGKIKVIKYAEDDPEPAFIPRDTFYRRYTFEYKARNVQPKPPLCLCNRPYNPTDRSAGSLMHFCPHPRCRRAYHARCLGSSRESSAVKVGVVNGDTAPRKSARKHASPVKKVKSKVKAETEKTTAGLTPRALRLLACSPDADEDVDLAGLILQGGEDHEGNAERKEQKKSVEDAGTTGDEDELDTIRLEPPRKRQRQTRNQPRSTSSQPSSSTAAETNPAPTLDKLLSAAPPKLLSIATQPLVRGGAFWEGGVSGNLGIVTRARRLVYAYLKAGGDDGILDGWEEVVFGVVQGEEGKDEANDENGTRKGEKDDEGDGVKIKNAIVRVDGGLQPFLCPVCSSAI
ncbi:hypothetical protein M413DRAFT_445493 [Hebeloma cylindrosporum]|uniref:BAH domain-containing protein n=1 Tax=Hebeloma cylindrosporum TaxID=76867 RepID=A0A0C3BY52_HEBCY|nr:hypothetical protein M413DRAFT_445493 [Hebeloma cylindrosporum h7]